MCPARWGTDGLNVSSFQHKHFGSEPGGSAHSPWAWICWFLSAFWSNLSCWWPGFGGRTRKTLQNPLLSVLALFSCSLAYLVFSLASQQATSCWIPNSPVTWEPFPWLFGRRVLSRQAVFAHHGFFSPITCENISSCLQGGFNGPESILPHYFQGLNQGLLPLCRGEEVAVPWGAASLPEVAVRLSHGKGRWSSALAMPASRLGCAHGIPVQVLFPATWLKWKSPSHCTNTVTTTHLCRGYRK